VPDILVRGAGPVGCAAALALRAAGHDVGLGADAQPPSAAFRPIALSYASRLILERLGVWPAVSGTPIERIQVSQAGGFGRTRLEAAECGVPALGYVTEYATLLGALREAAHDLVSTQTEARCVVHAEGWSGDAHEKNYEQHALVARIACRPPAGQTAFERFTPGGPLALLPLQDTFALIWSSTPAECASLEAASEAHFLARLADAAGMALGEPTGVSGRSAMALKMRVRDARVAERAVYIGNAAQTLHPVAGQGLNLGLRDAWELAETLRGAADPGDARLLAAYAARRRLDAGATIRGTDLLARLFLGSGALPRAARGVALSALDLFPAPRRFFARRMIFGASAFP
jgi:2-octaprenyl-6-methoxyphenol hydroxylase